MYIKAYQTKYYSIKNINFNFNTNFNCNLTNVLRFEKKNVLLLKFIYL